MSFAFLSELKELVHDGLRGAGFVPGVARAVRFGQREARRLRSLFRIENFGIVMCRQFLWTHNQFSVFGFQFSVPGALAEN